MLSLAILRVAPATYREAHRLLADITIQQFSMLCLRADQPEEHRSRFYQRLVQSIYHGLCSVSQTSTHPRASAVANAPATRLPKPEFLPNDEDDRIRVLYETYYLEFLERPPIWALSRRFALDALKVDILNLFKDTWNQRNAKPRPAGVLETINADILRAAQSFGPTEQRYAACWPTDKISAMPPPFSKLWVDELLFSDGYEAAEHFVSLALPPSMALPIVSDYQNTSIVALDQRAAQDAEAWKKHFESRECEDTELKEAVTLLERYAAVKAYQADRVAESEGKQKAIERLTAAYVYFRIAQQVGRIAAKTRGLDDHRLSVSSSRNFVRVCLKLAKLLRENGGAQADLGILFARARLVIDRLARQLHNFPADRAYLLVLDSAYVRLKHADKRRAAAKLEQAELLLASERNRPRLTMRFLHERAKILRLLSDGGNGKALLAAAKRDAELLTVIATGHKSKLFIALAKELLNEMAVPFADP
jgi:hypothetical protein